MRVTIKKLQGGECILDILPTTTITEIKNKVFEKLGIPIQEQKLLLVGRTLADDHTVAAYPTIKDGSKINLIIKKPETPVTKSEEPAKEIEKPIKKSDGEKPIKKSDGLYEESIKLFKEQGMNDTDAINHAKKLLKIVKDKFNKMSYDDIDKLALDCLMNECGLQQVSQDKDADYEETL